MQSSNRRVYNADYRSNLEDEPATQDNEPGTGADTSNNTDPLDPQEMTFKKRYGDLRSHTNSLNERISQLETQLREASKKEIRIPSSREELTEFAKTYPDVYRHIRSIAMAELMSEKENIEIETRSVREALSKTQQELGLAKIRRAHEDFDEINLSQEFQDWASVQPKQIQDWLFESDDPILCIKALDFYKLETRKPKPRGRPVGSSAEQINLRSSVDTGEGNKKIWKDSEVRKLHPKDFEKFEAEIDAARREGRYDESA